MSSTDNSYLATEPVGRLMRRYGLPCVISLLVAALYNVVDQIFIANAAYLGSCGNAANTAVFPLTVAALAVAVMIGDGCCAFVSLSLGRGDGRQAQDSVGNAIIVCLAFSLLLTALFLLLANPLLAAFGGRVNEQTWAFSREYFFWITLGLPFYMFGQAMNPIIRADGSPRFAMLSTLAGAVINLILDPLFIFVFHWGMMGAAVATVAGQVVTAALAVVYLRRARLLRLQRSNFRLHPRLIGRVLLLGLCSFLAQISLVAAMAAVNNMLSYYGARDSVFGQSAYAQIPLAVLGIVMKFFQIVISVVIGLAAGCIPIAGYNQGAGLAGRSRALLTRLLLCELAVGAVALLCAEALPRPLIALFGAANESVYYTEFACRAFRTYLCLLPLAAVNKAAFIFLQAQGQAGLSAFLSMLREVVLGVGLALLLPRFLALDGVLWSMPAADLLTFIASVIVLCRCYRRLNRDAAAQQAAPPLS